MHANSFRIGLFVTLLVCPAVAKVDLPTPRFFVEDQAGIIRDDVEQKLNRLLAALEQKTGAQVIVYTIQTLDGEPIEQFTLRHAEKWQLGQKDKDNGVLVLIALRDRKYRIEVGEGLEGALPDGLVGSIGRKYFRTYFRRGDYTTGIYRGMLALIEKIAQEYKVELPGLVAATAASARHTGATRQRGNGTRTYSRRESAMGCCCSFTPLLLILIVLGGLRSRMGYHRRWAYGGSSSWLWWLLLGSMMGGGRRHHGGFGSGFGGGFGGGGFGGGGFGGGGFGGFGGGGGGSFGGGGASGGW